MDIVFTPDDWDRIRQAFTAWWDHRLDRPLVLPHNVPRPGREGLPGYQHFHTSYPLDMPAERIVEIQRSHLAARQYVGDSFPTVFVNFGAGVLAEALGCRLHPTERTVWFEPAPGTTVETLEVRFNPETPWWRRLRELTAAFVEGLGETVQISHTDLGGNLDILASLVGTEQLLVDTLERPEAVERAVGAITATWLEAYRLLERIIRPICPGTVPWAPTWAPGRGYMLQSDFAYMISPEMFARFVMPDLRACCEYLDYGFYHLDGVGQIPHLDQLLSIERLRGIQWVPGDGKPPPDGWIELLGRIKQAGRLQQLFVSAEGARHICRELGGSGFLLAVGDRMSADQARALCDELYAMG